MGNIFTDLLKGEVWQWGLAAFILLLLLYITDIPPSIFNFFIRILKLKDLSMESNQDKNWSKLPTNYKKIPVAGFIEDRVSRKKLQEYIKQFIKDRQSGMSWLNIRLYNDEAPNNRSNQNENTEYRKFKSRDSLKIVGTPITIVSGLPGTGKSTFVLNHIENERGKGKVDFVIYFPFADFSSKYNSLNNLQDKDLEENFWNDIRSSIIYTGVSEYKKPSANLISYYINYGWCYILIDDVIDMSKLERFVDGLYKYKSTCHRKNKNLRIIITTRERDLQKIKDKGYAGVLTIQPLTQEDAQSFFYEKCNQLGIDLQQRDFFDLAEEKTSLLTFENRFTQNPLFVEIVVSMIRERGFKKLSETFQKSVGAVYKEFINILFTRNTDSALYPKFYASYRKLAYNIKKTNSTNFTNDKIATVFGGSPFDENFLNANVLLVRKNESGQLSYSFIHQTLSDILYIEEIVKANNYSDFINVNTIGEEFTFYLKEQILELDQYLPLLKTNLSIATNILDDGFLQKIKTQSVSATAQSIMDGAIKEFIVKPGVAPDEHSLINLYNKLSANIPNQGEYLLAKLNGITITEKIIRFFLAFNSPELNQFFLAKMVNNENSGDFASLISAGYPPLLDLIKSRLTKAELNTAFQNKLLLFLLSPGISNDNNKRYSTWLLNDIQQFSDDTLRVLLQNKYIREKILLRGYENKNVLITKRLHRLLFDFDGRTIFLPKGNYNIKENNVYNPQSILVSKTPLTILVRANNNYEAEMKTLNTVQIQLMTFEQLQIASSLFAKTWAGDLFGLVSLSSEEIINRGILYEAYKDNNRSILRFAFRQNKEQGLMKNNKDLTYTSSFAENIIYRTISFCN
jgi:hypothetical protein